MQKMPVVTSALHWKFSLSDFPLMFDDKKSSQQTPGDKYSWEYNSLLWYYRFLSILNTIITVRQPNHQWPK